MPRKNKAAAGPAVAELDEPVTIGTRGEIIHAETNGHPPEVPNGAAGSAGELIETLPFFEALSAMTPRDWEDHIVYLYRTDAEIPKEVLEATGRDKYVDKVTHAFDEEYVKRQHGGGTYLALLKFAKDSSKKTRRGYRFAIDGPAKLQEGFVPKAGTIVAPGTGGGPGATTTSSPSEQQNTVQMFLGALDKILNAAKENKMPQDQVMSNVLQLMQTASAKAIEVAAAGASKSAGSMTGNPLIDQLITTMITRLASPPDFAAQMKSFAELMNTMRPAAEEKEDSGSADPLDALAKLKDTFDIDFRSLLSGRAGKDDWRIELARALPGALTALNNWFTVRMEEIRLTRELRVAQMLPGAVAGAPPPPPATTPKIQPIPAPAAAIPSPLPAGFAAAVANTTPGAGPATATTGTSQEVEEQMNMFLSQLAETIANQFESGEDGRTAAIVVMAKFPPQLVEMMRPFLRDPKQVRAWVENNEVLADCAENKAWEKFEAEFLQTVLGTPSQAA